MNAAHLHLLFTHLPIVGIVIAILINAYALWSKSDEMKKFTLWAYIVLGIFAILAYMTGDSAEDIMKTYPGITEDITEPHEHLAMAFFTGVMILSILAFAGLYRTKTNEPLLRKFNLYLLILAILVSVLAYFTGSTGGDIRHTEIKEGVYKSNP